MTFYDLVQDVVKHLLEKELYCYECNAKLRVRHTGGYPRKAVLTCPMCNTEIYYMVEVSG